MPKPSMDLSAFVGKLFEEQDGDVLREGVRVLAQALMESEVTALVGASVTSAATTGRPTATAPGSGRGIHGWAPSTGEGFWLYNPGRRLLRAGEPRGTVAHA